jgi:DNA-binding CsgD family transcriptional regulator
MIDALRRLDELFAATVETLDLAIAELGDAERRAPAGGPGGATPDPAGAPERDGRRPSRRPARRSAPSAPSARTLSSAAVAAPGVDPGLPSPAEHRVLELLPTTLTRREIADELHLSMNTVKSHTRMLYLRLGVTTRTAAVGAARERGLLPWSPGAMS